MVVINTKLSVKDILAENGFTEENYYEAIKALEKLSSNKQMLLEYVKNSIKEDHMIDNQIQNMLQMGGAPNALFNLIKILLILTGILFSMIGMAVPLIYSFDAVECGLGLNLVLDDPSTYCTDYKELSKSGKNTFMVPLIMFAVAVPMMKFCIKKGMQLEEAFNNVLNHPFFQLLLVLSNISQEQRFREENPGWTAMTDITDAVERLSRGGRTRKHKRSKKNKKTIRK